MLVNETVCGTVGRFVLGLRNEISCCHETLDVRRKRLPAAVVRATGAFQVGNTQELRTRYMLYQMGVLIHRT